MEATQLIGKKAKVKLCRYGWPVEVVSVTDVQGALMGNMRVLTEAGHTALALYPPLEVLD